MTEYYEKLLALTGDRSKTAEQRIDEAFALKEQAKPDNDVEAARYDSLTYGVLTALR